MSGGNKVVEISGDQSSESAQEAEKPPIASDADHVPMVAPHRDELLASYDVPSRRPYSSRLALFLSAVALLWIAGTVILNVPTFEAAVGRLLNTSAVGAIARSVINTIPVLLILITIWFVARRSSEQDVVSLNNTLERLTAEREAMMRLIADSERRLYEGANAIYAQGEQLDALGTATVNKIATLRAMIDEEVAQIAVQTNGLKNAAAVARSDMAVLLANLPKAQIETRKIADALRDAGSAAHVQTECLTEQLVELAQQATRSEQISVEAADLLATQISQMARQSSATQTQVSECRAALVEAEDGHLNSLLGHTRHIKNQIEGIGAALAQHDDLSAKLLDRLRDGLADVEGRLAAIDTHGMERTERLTDAIKALTEHSHKLREELAAGGNQTHELIAEAEALMVALDAAARELDETLPSALERVARVTAVTTGRIAEAAAQADAISNKLKANSAEMAAIDTAFGHHHTHLEAARTLLSEHNAAAQTFVDTVTAAQTQMETVAGGASIQLVEALMRVRETAKLASERAHEAIANVIPDAVAALGSASETAFRQVLDQGVKAQLAEVSSVAERAVASANEATERLMRQMLTISETSAAFAAQMADAEQTQESNAQTSLSRRVSLLIESLNSISIDVTKILSNEVTDSAWSSYLKGDRGIFTRRAVRLIDASDMRDILRHYGEDAEFRAHVNHYIHDFEAMLRAVLNSRESGPLSVTLLSSDMGKLYVALAHAIERLRT